MKLTKISSPYAKTLLARGSFCCLKKEYMRRKKKFESVDAELKDILRIAGGVHPEKIKPESKIRTLLNDSIDQVHALLLVEAFLYKSSKVVIPDEIVEKIITYADLLDFVENAVPIFDREIKE